MPQNLPRSGAATAIPARFEQQRERVLRIMARWEASIRAVSFAGPVYQDQRGLQLSAGSSR